MTTNITVGVLALQGAFLEHLKLLRQASEHLPLPENLAWDFIEVRTPVELARCEALIIPGGESTTVSLVAARSNLLEPLRDFVKYSLQFCASLLRQRLTFVRKSGSKANMGHLCRAYTTCRIHQSNEERRAGSHWWVGRKSKPESFRKAD